MRKMKDSCKEEWSLKDLLEDIISIETNTAKRKLKWRLLIQLGMVKKSSLSLNGTKLELSVTPISLSKIDMLAKLISKELCHK